MRRAPNILLVAGAVAFIVVLAVSAVWQADIRWLHFFQAWMYLAAIALRRRRVGLFIGASAAGLWDYINLFVTSFLRNGVNELVHWIQTGQVARPDQLIAVAAWLSNLLVIVGSVWAYGRRDDKRPRDLLAFVLTFALTTGFFAAAMALFQPRYLALFPALLHPHWP
jgi:hypothetical protein